MYFRSVFFKIKIKHFVCLLTLCFALIVATGLLTHLFEYDYHTAFEYPYVGDIHESLLQLRAHEEPKIKPINSYNYEFLSDCKKKCDRENYLRLVYIVKSSPENFENRQAIRKTWGYERRFSDVNIRTVFILGVRQDTQLQIRSEMSHYRDIVLTNFTDSYFNNTIKTMMGFKWAVSMCSNSQFYMFVDDDYYVSTKNVLRFIRNPVNYPEYVKQHMFDKNKLMQFELPDDVRFYAGYVFFSAPHRHYFSKWYVSLDEYPYHKWPPYVTAGAYILSREALLDFYFGSFYTKHFRFDDIYVGLIAKKLDVEPFHCEHFHFYKKQYYRSNYNFTIASHGYDPIELSTVWNEQKSLGNA